MHTSYEDLWMLVVVHVRTIRPEFHRSPPARFFLFNTGVRFPSNSTRTFPDMHATSRPRPCLLSCRPLACGGNGNGVHRKSVGWGGVHGPVRATHAVSVPFVLKSRETVVVTTDDVPCPEHVVTIIAHPRDDRLLRRGAQVSQLSDCSRRIHGRG